MDAHFGKRLKALREIRLLTQEQASGLMGFPHRQTLAMVEAGKRSLSADELVRATEVFGVPLDYFTDRFSVAGEAQFSWRKRDSVGSDEIEAFESKVGRLFGAYRALCGSLGEDCRRSGRRLPIGRASTPADAVRAGEDLAREMARDAEDPAWLAPAVEDTFGIPVLNVDAPRNLSGAVCHLEDMDGIVVNRSDAQGRRSFDAAHELFHALTWASMPPEHVEQAGEERKRGRPSHVEQLADGFAAGLLMPTHRLEVLPGWGDLPRDEDALIKWLNTAADSLGVSSMALAYRLRDTGRLDEAAFKKILKSPGIRMNGAAAAPPPPPPYSPKFIGVLVRAMDDGRIAARRAAGLLGMDVDGFGDLCETHGFERSPI